MENIVESNVIDAAEMTGEFLIVTVGKRTIKASCSGQVIEALKRAKKPLKLIELASKVRLTKAGKALEVKDVKVRVRQCVEWYRKNTVDGAGPFVAQTEAGEYFLVRVTE